jgi:hypothetical protein
MALATLGGVGVGIVIYGGVVLLLRISEVRGLGEAVRQRLGRA